MRKVLALVKRISPETWPFIGMILVGWILTALAKFEVWGMVPLGIAMFVAALLVSLAVVKIRSHRISKDVPARIKIAYFANKVVLVTIIAGIIISVIMVGQPATLILAGIAFWLGSDLISMHLIRRYPALKQMYSRAQT